MLTLSPSAVETVDSLLHSEDIPADAGLRIRAASESELAIELALEPEAGDQVIEEQGARVFVDPVAAPILEHAELDARLDGDQIAFGLAPAADAGAPAADAANNGHVS